MKRSTTKHLPKAASPAPEFKPQRWIPHDYQLRAVRWLLSHAGSGVFADPGLGKTSIILAALKVLKAEGELRKGAFIVAPLRPLYNVWDPEGEDSEPRKWLDFQDLRFKMLHGPGKDAALQEKADVYLINPDGLGWLFRTAGRERLRGCPLIVDESTQFKHSNTQRFKLLRWHLPLFSRRWIATGGPSPNGLLDLFGQIYICDLGNSLGAYITHYRRRFFQPTGYGGYEWVLQGSNEKEQEKTADRIYKAISPLIFTLSEKDHLKLPKIHGSLAHSKEPNFTKVKLPKAAREKFAKLEEEFFLEMGDGMITASNAAVKHQKLRQAANGGIYLDPKPQEEGRPRAKRQWALLHEEKTDAVVELLDELDGRAAVIAVEFHHDTERLRMHKRLRNVPAIGEGTPKEDRLLAADWNRGRLSELIVNPASFYSGSNMQRGGDALIFHSLAWNFEHYDQLVRRFWRQGRKRPFFVHHIIAEGTHDALVAAGLRSKNKEQRGLLDALRTLARARRGARAGGAP